MSTKTTKIDSKYLGAEDITDDDRNYSGSKYQDVRDAIFSNPYYSNWGADGEPSLPIYPVTLRQVLTGILPFGKKFQFLQAARRTVDSNADLRWGPDGKGYRRLLHPNGICLTGKWEITESNNYSGYFKKGSEALMIGRYSTCCTESRRGNTRSLSLVGKLFPTTNPNHTELLQTANFIAQEDLGGERTNYINDAEIRNAPNTSSWRRGSGIPIFLITGAVFLRADKEPGVRQLYEIAEMGKPEEEATSCPEFIRFVVDENQARIEGENLDFRDEILAQIYDKGDSKAKRQLIFHIEVSNEGTKRGPAFYQRRYIKNWQRIGRITFDEAVASYNGDFVIHFNHPTWRHDRNDPSTGVRVDGRKV